MKKRFVIRMMNCKVWEVCYKSSLQEMEMMKCIWRLKMDITTFPTKSVNNCHLTFVDFARTWLISFTQDYNITSWFLISNNHTHLKCNFKHTLCNKMSIYKSTKWNCEISRKCNVPTKFNVFNFFAFKAYN